MLYLKILGCHFGCNNWSINKQRILIKHRAFSTLGYIISDREGTWCVRCFHKYKLYRAFQLSEGTPDQWIKINKKMKNKFCSVCRKRIVR